MPTYTRSDLKGRVNAGIKGKQGILVSFNDTINQAVREVLMETDLRSTRRKTIIMPALFDDITSYPVPADLKDMALISIHDQDDKQYRGVDLVPFERWGETHGPAARDNVNINSINQISGRYLNKVAFDDHDSIRKLRMNLPVTGSSLQISSLDALDAGGGTWTLFGDAVNVAVDSFNYARGGGSIKWDISNAGGTTAGIQNTGLDAQDISPYLDATGSAFVYVYITSPTDITNFIFRIGSDSSNYITQTVTETHEGNAFSEGWNLLRFDLDSATEVGTNVPTAITYCNVHMTKTAGKISEPDYRFDNIVLKNGDIHNIVYYSRYGWQDSTGAWLENSTADADFLNADNSEYQMFIYKGIELAAMECDEEQASQMAARKYAIARERYLSNNPSEKLYMIVDYMFDNFL